ncbi:MAG: hypothetical protein AB9866_12840 [Syntrophobacteraceae bacterium]
MHTCCGSLPPQIGAIRSEPLRSLYGKLSCGRSASPDPRQVYAICIDTVSIHQIIKKSAQ